MTEISLETCYTIVGSFFKHFEGNFLINVLVGEYYGKRGFRRRLTIQDTMALNIYRFYMEILSLKAFHRFVRRFHRDTFPDFPNYENFLKATNKSLPLMTVFVNSVLAKNRERMRGRKVHFVDSTPVEVCKNSKISRHRVARGYASRGKSTKGWFFGFKLHGVCTEDMTVESLMFTTGAVHDSRMAQKVTKDIVGKVFADAGYQLRKEDLAALAEGGVFMHNATRKNMKRLIAKEQFDDIERRNIIETVWSVLKGSFSLVYTKARSVTGMFRHFFYSIAAFLLSHSHLDFRLAIAY